MTVTFGDFEWDADKAAANAAKHGVTLEAVTVFLDLDYLLVRDALEPERFVALGTSRARRATRRERETYERRRESD